MSALASLEYIWIDGAKPTAKLRSKTKIVHRDELNKPPPDWGFDGSSTEQAQGNSSDCILKPVRSILNPLPPFLGGENRLVLCEVLDANGNPHPSNTRAKLVELCKKFKDAECLFGIEQEYTFYHGSRHAGDAGIPLGWPERGPANPQGKYYCGVGSDEVYGREIVLKHLEVCIKAGIPIAGINAEVMPGQWEFQIGTVDALDVCDYLWLARFLLYRIAEESKVTVRLDQKPLAGDWNGAGAHTNFSTKKMREDGGIDYCVLACEKLKRKFEVEGFPSVYGAGYKKRLTGAHETCSYNEFKYGIGDRTASIRIPLPVEKVGKGYIEDRRPGANIDPYLVTTYLIETICSSEGQPVSSPVYGAYEDITPLPPQKPG